MSKTVFKRPDNASEATIVVVAHPFKLNGEETEKVTIPAIRGKHLARIPFRYGTIPTIGQQVEWASWVVQPLGAIEEMHPADAIEISNEVYAQLGKALATGEQPSE